MSENEFVVPPTHPLWNAVNDDDWNGHTLNNLIVRLKGVRVTMYPPKDYDDATFGKLVLSLLQHGVAAIIIDNLGIYTPPARVEPKVGDRIMWIDDDLLLLDAKITELREMEIVAVDENGEHRLDPKGFADGRLQVLGR